MVIKHILYYTHTDPPSGAPLNLTITISTTSIMLNWERVYCSKRNGNITGHIIQYSINGTLMNTTVNGDSTLSVVLGGFVQRQVYSIGVAAMNEIGMGPFNYITFQGKRNQFNNN